MLCRDDDRTSLQTTIQDGPLCLLEDGQITQPRTETQAW
jgi:hypothetical protein